MKIIFADGIIFLISLYSGEVFMDVWCKPSAERVFKHTRKQKKDCARLFLHTGKNMFVSGQILLREVKCAFDVTDVSISGLPDGVSAEICVQDYAVFNDGVPYPDIQKPGKSVHVLANATQGLWLHFWVSESAEAGKTNITCIVKTTRGDFEAHVMLRVYPVTIPEPKDSAFGHEYFLFSTDGFALKGETCEPPITPFYDTHLYSEDWWLLMANIARTMKILRVNSINIASLNLLKDAGTKRISETEWHFDFTILDRFVETFLSEGSFRYLTIAAAVASVNGETIQGIDEQGMPINYEIGKPDAEHWARAYWGGLYKHFAEKGWLSKMGLRLQDEPHSAEYWLWARRIAKEVCPDVICGDPMDTHKTSLQLEGECDLYIPRLEVYASDPYFYRERQKAGDTVWCYSCCFPEENWWLNKFLDLPHSYSRMIKWACFSQGITGYLHWGFNYWGDKTIYGIQPAARYKGDGYIVYPDVESFDVLLSTRAVATREGLYDWELLNMLAQKDASAALAISRSVARTFDDFTDDSENLDYARVRLLEAICE